MQLDSVQGVDQGQMEAALVNGAEKGRPAAAVEDRAAIARRLRQPDSVWRRNLIAERRMGRKGFHGPVLSMAARAAEMNGHGPL